jgi:hypothetical protein
MFHRDACRTVGFVAALLLMACSGRAQVEGADSTVPDTKIVDTGDLGQQVPDSPPVDVEGPGEVEDKGAPAGEGASPGCQTAVPLHCGDRFSHSTVLQGRPDEWSGYACTARLESGPEVIYSFQAEVDCQVTVSLEELAVDLDLLVLDGCDPWSCIKAASTPLDIQDIEEVTFGAIAGAEYFVVVDGYAGASGSYQVRVECSGSSKETGLTDGIWQMHVDRKLKGLPGDVQFPSDPLDEEDYEPVDDGPVYKVVVSGEGKSVEIGDEPFVGVLEPGNPGEWMFNLTEGTFAGGRFVVWASELALQAELTIYGSGVPIVSSERGPLAKGEH